MGGSTAATRRIAAAFLGAATLIAACADGLPGRPGNPASHSTTLGRELGGDFTVARGSELLGTVFPGHSPDASATSESSSGDDVWSAVLRLTGNPVRVFNRYLRQAHDAGFDVGAECLLSYADRGTVPPRDRLRSRHLLGLRCRAIGSTPGDGRGGPEALTVELRRSAGDAPYDDTVSIRFARRAAGTAPATPPQGWPATLPAEWETGVPPPPDPPDVATPGEPIRDVDPDFARPIDVVEGTRLLAPPGLPCAQRGGFDAVFEVSDEVDRVLDVYAEQFRDIGMRKERSTARFRGREATIDAGVGESGNYGAVAIAGSQADATYLHLWFCPTT